MNRAIWSRLVAGVTGKSYINANKLVADMEKLGLLKETTGYKRNRRFAYQPYLSLFEEP